MDGHRFLARAMFACVVAVAALSSGAAHGTSIFLKFQGIDGESTNEKHKGWAELSSASWGVSATPASNPGGGGVAGRPRFQDLSWTQPVDKTVPKLFDAIAKGTTNPLVTLDFTFGVTPETYFQMTFKKAVLTSLNLGAAGDARAALSGSFAYSEISMTYTEFDLMTGRAKGTVTATYDLETGTGSAAALAGVFALGSAGPGTPIPAVPEPTAWPWVLVGLGLLGRRLRRSSAPDKERSTGIDVTVLGNSGLEDLT